MRTKKFKMALWMAAIICLTGCAESGQAAGEDSGASTSVISTEENTSSISETSGTESMDATQEPVTAEFFAMDTIMQVQAYGGDAQKAVEEAQAEVERLDDLLSTGKTDSEVSLLNAQGGGILSEDGKYLMKRSLELYDSTDGKFDITIYPVMELWGFAVADIEEMTAANIETDENADVDVDADAVAQHVPDTEALAQAMRLVDSSKIAFDEESGEVNFLEESQKIDFGGIAKGYTSARIMEIFRENGVESGLVSLGGNIQTLGTKPNGDAWKVGIQDPEDLGNVLMGIEVTDKAVITSGGYQRYFEQDEVVYHHIIDPSTGYPADSGLTSVTIVSEDGTLADGLATAIFIMGKDEATSYWREHSDEFDMILVESDGTISVTEGVAEDIFTDTEFEVIAE